MVVVVVRPPPPPSPVPWVKTDGVDQVRERKSGGRREAKKEDMNATDK